MVSVRFGSVARLEGRLVNPPVWKPDSTPAESEAYMKAMTDAQVLFQAKVQDHVDQLVRSQPGGGETPKAVAFPINPFHSLVVDGPDVAKLAMAILSRKAQYLKAFTEALVAQQAAGKVTPRVMEDADLEKAPAPEGFNMGLLGANLHHVTRERLIGLAESHTLLDHFHNTQDAVQIDL
jgi:hypothetical protein